jgi:hypothetical protein
MAEELSDPDRAHAYHEAGHAAMRICFGIVLEGVTIDGIPETGGDPGLWGAPSQSDALRSWRNAEYPSPIPAGIVRELIQLVVITMAGEISQYNEIAIKRPFPDS